MIFFLHPPNFSIHQLVGAELGIFHSTTSNNQSSIYHMSVYATSKLRLWNIKLKDLQRILLGTRVPRTLESTPKKDYAQEHLKIFNNCSLSKWIDTIDFDVSRLNMKLWIGHRTTVREITRDSVSFLHSNGEGNPKQGQERHVVITSSQFLRVLSVQEV